MITTIKFAKSRENAIIPTKRSGDGCYDVYAYFDEEYIIIQPHTVKLIPTGICSAFDEGYRIGIRERGSNTKSGLITMAGQIDASYRGEWFVALYNGNDIPVEITKNITDVEKYEDFIRVPYSKAVAQFALEIVPEANTETISFYELISIPSERGEGCLGSSQK